MIKVPRFLTETGDFRLFFVFDQLPRGVDEVLELRVLHGADHEALAGGVDVLAGDLEHPIRLAQAPQAL